MLALTIEFYPQRLIFLAQMAPHKKNMNMIFIEQQINYYSLPTSQIMSDMQKRDQIQIGLKWLRPKSHKRSTVFIHL